MANPTVAIDITARLDGLRQELAKMPEIGAAAAKQMTAAMAKDIRSNTTATKALADQNRKMAESLDQTAVSGNKALKALGPLGGVLSKLDPTAGAASSSIAALTSAFEGFEAAGLSISGSVLVPLGVGVVALTEIVAAGVLAWKASNIEEERAADRAKDLTTFERTLASVIDDTKRAEIERAVALGLINEQAGKELEIRAASFTKLNGLTADSTKRAQELRQEQNSLVTAYVDAGRAVGDYLGPVGFLQKAIYSLGRGSEDIQADLDTETAKRAAAQDSVKDLTAALISESRAKDEKRKKDEEEQKARQANEERIRKEEAALRSLTDALNAEADAAGAVADRYEAGLEKLRDMQDKALGNSGSAMQKLRAEQDAARQEAVDTAAEAVKGAGVTAAAQEEINQQLTKTLAAQDKEYAAKKSALIATMVEDQIDAAKKVAEAERVYNNRQVAAYADSAGAIADISGTLSDVMVDKNKETAMALFAVHKGAAMVQAAINTALAISDVWAEPTTPYPVKIAESVAVGLTGAAIEASIAAQPPPSFGDTPAVQQMASGGNVRLASGDYFAAARNPADLQKQVSATSEPFAGRATGGPGYTLIGSRAWGRFVRDDVREVGALSDVLASRRGTPLGRRA